MNDVCHGAMKTKSRKVLCTFLLSLFPLLVLAEPLNASPFKAATRHYHESGQYDRAFAAVIKKALYYLQFRVNQNARLPQPKKLAMVFDVDETVLSNYAERECLHFDATDRSAGALDLQARDPALQSALTLYHYARKHDVAVFFITARKEQERESTEAYVKALGFRKWEGFYFEPSGYQKKSATYFKIADQKKITELGYDIILNLADEYAAIRVGYSDMSFKLPNPFYSTS